MAKTVAIIGAGVAGLAAGCYGQMNGYRTTIFEQHHLPGGLCTAWERHGYVFDGCIHYLFGSGEGLPFHGLWEDLGAVQGRRFVDHDEMLRVIAPDGRALIAYADPDRLREHMLALSPRDRRHIDALCGGIRRFEDFDMSAAYRRPRHLQTIGDRLRFVRETLPYGPALARWGLMPARSFADRFEDPFLRRAVRHLFGWEEIPMMVGMSLLAYMHRGNAGFPVGASLEFARALERRYVELGGEIVYRAPVERILVEEGGGGTARAAGIRLYDDSVHAADEVISAADGRATIFEMLGGRFVDRDIRRRYDGHLPMHSQVQVSLGVKRDLSAEPHWATYLLDEPITVAGDERFEIAVKHYCFDPTLAPEGRSVLIAMLTTSYGYWRRVYDKRPYDLEQTQVSDTLIGFLERRYPGISDEIEVVDEATPLSYERYTGNWNGATCGWLLTRQTMPLMLRGVPTTLPGLRGFRMAGQWVEPGGSVPIAAMSGRNAIQAICHEDHLPFVATRP